MESREDIQQELKENCPTLLSVGDTNVYTLSPNYFKTLAGEIVSKINNGEKAAYYFSGAMPFTIPSGYFDGLANRIKERIAQSSKSEITVELEEIAPFLNTVSKQPVYAIPQNYFEQVSVNKSQLAKIIKPSFRTTALKYLAAAVVAGFLATGAFLVIDRNASVSQAAINPQVAVRNLSEQEIVEYLKTTSLSEDVTSVVAKQPATQVEIKQSVKEMTDEEIQKFLNEYGEGDEI